MSYKKPVCDCGKELVWWEQAVYTETYKISQFGLKTKKKVYSMPEGALNYQRLHCIDCGSEYEIKEDGKGRIIRGELLSG